MAVADRVAAGAALLDEKDPGWWRADAVPGIDPDALVLDDACMCVLGQRCPLEYRGAAHPYWHYAYVLAEFDGDPVEGLWDAAVTRWAVPYGFVEAEDEAPRLTAEWARVIRERRATA